MIFELNTYFLKPAATGNFESRFEKLLPDFSGHLNLLASWHTEIGPLNRVIQVCSYKDLKHRTEDKKALAKNALWRDLVGSQGPVLKKGSEVVLPAPFMKPLSGRDFGKGNIYEIRIYTIQPGTMAEVLQAWTTAMPWREKFSPMAAWWYSESPRGDKFIQVWPYKDLSERDRVHLELARNPLGPPHPYRNSLLTQDIWILAPSSFSPVK